MIIILRIVKNYRKLFIYWRNLYNFWIIKVIKIFNYKYLLLKEQSY